jgi:hypothetical protein
MTPIIGANVKYLDEIHTLEFNPIKGVEIKFSDSFISNDGNGKYSFKSVDALEKYNKRLKSSINYTADFQFISRGKIIGKSKANIKLYAKTVCNLDSIESTTYNDVQTVSGYVPSMSNVYINGEQVGIDTSDINGYRFSKEIYLENGKNLIKVRVVRQGEIPYEKNLYISKETDEVTPEAPEITIPEVTYSDIVNVYIKTSPLYTIYINDEKFEVNSDGIVSIDYTLLDGFAKYKWKIVIYDENNNEVLNNEYYSTYTSNN